MSALAAETIKKVTLELGGKSAFVVLDDAPLEKAMPAGVNNAMLNSGQTCSAWTRMVVPRAHAGRGARARVRRARRGCRLGDPLDPEDEARSAGLGRAARAGRRLHPEGRAGRRASGGRRQAAGRFPARPLRRADDLRRRPVEDDDRAGRDLRSRAAVLPYDTEEEAIAIANDTIYGLAGGVWSGDKDRALRVARRLRTGQVDVNGGRFNPLAPFGGYKRSGIGREFGKYGLEEYFQVKAIQC